MARNRKGNDTLKKKVLLVDDDPDILEAVSYLLECEGYDVIAMKNARNVKYFAVHDRPNVILLDIFISGYDGRDIAKFLKNRTDTKVIPIIMISAAKDIERSAKMSGADAFLSKPFDVSDLLLLIEDFLARPGR